jgi:hypothetical protein
VADRQDAVGAVMDYRLDLMLTRDPVVSWLNSGVEFCCQSRFSSWFIKKLNNILLSMG